jgi:hypothetical protein
LNLESESADIGRLLSEDGLLASIVNRDIDALDFQLNVKCDSCVFSRALPSRKRAPTAA